MFCETRAVDPMQLVIYQPDIPQNLGSLIRLCACLDAPLHIIEPCGFLLDDKRMRRAAMDYFDLAHITRHASFERFLEWRTEHKSRLLLLSTKAEGSYTEFAYAPGDMLLVGRESSGVPAGVRASADHGIRIPMHPQARSLNVALSAALVLGEAIRQTRSAT